MCSKEILLHAQNMLIILDSLVILTGEESARIFTLITNRIYAYKLQNYEVNGQKHNLDLLDVSKH